MVYPRGPEALVCVTGHPGQTVPCTCGHPLCTPRVSADFRGTVDVDWVRCGGCRAHVVVRVTAE